MKEILYNNMDEHPHRLVLLADLTNTELEDWEQTNGPDSGLGEDYYYSHSTTGSEAWINEDQDHMVIVCDETTIFEGDPKDIL